MLFCCAFLLFCFFAFLLFCFLLIVSVDCFRFFVFAIVCRELFRFCLSSPSFRCTCVWLCCLFFVFWLSLFAFVFISFSFLAFIVFFVSFRSVFYRFLIVFSFLLFPSPPPPSFSPGRRPARLRKRRPLLAAGHAGPRRLEAHAHRTGQRAQGVCPAPLRAEAAKRQRSP